MHEFDDFIKQKIKEGGTEVPSSVSARIEQVLSGLPEKENKKATIRLFPKIACAAACFLFVFLVVLPNCSVVYAQAVEKIPVIGSLTKVVTIRNYFYSDDKHEMDIDVPKIEGENNEAVDYINKDVDELTKILANRFDEDLKEIGDKGHSAIYVDYDVVTNTNEWFTLKIRVFEAAGSSNTYYKYYHIDKVNGKIVALGDLSASDDFYHILVDEIRRQMRERMAADPEEVYWVDNTGIGWEFEKLDAAHNFYWNENGDLTIAFDKYEIAPGSMGTPEFTISKDLLKDVLKQEYR